MSEPKKMRAGDFIRKPITEDQAQKLEQQQVLSYFMKHVMALTSEAEDLRNKLQAAQNTQE